MNCPFISLGEIHDPMLREAARKILACAACPTEYFCDSCNCLYCPFFPDKLTQQLLAIEMNVVKTHPRHVPATHSERPDSHAPDGQRASAGA
jgi:hypothetical protein